MQQIEIPVEGKYRICDIYQASDHSVNLQDGRLKMTFNESFDAVAVLLEKC